MATWSSLSFQDSASPLIEQLTFFHDHTMIIIRLITILVGYIIACLLIPNLPNRLLSEEQSIETIWTIIPAITLIFIALPSLRLLYLLDEVNAPRITLKTIGHQWYWSYEYSDFSNIEFDAYISPQNDIIRKDFRLLEVDNRTVLPFKTQIRCLITAADVLHSWTVPSLGVKADAVPGRLNQVSFLIKRPGILFGQCSEICGANHSFIPIIIESVNIKTFSKWILNFN
jgi:cytochrome c oxidase subunit 2